jgi:hypothetical protein
MKALAAFLLIAAAATAQDAARQRADAQLQFGLVATRAVANFRSADSIEASLNEDGATLNASLAALRVNIEKALDDAQAAIDKNDFAAAKTRIERAGAMLDRFARALGGG